MIDKLQAAEYRFDELTQKLTDPEVLGNSAAYRKTATEHSELEELVTVYRAYKNAVKERDEAKEMLSGTLEATLSAFIKTSPVKHPTKAYSKRPIAKKNSKKVRWPFCHRKRPTLSALSPYKT